jgi:hypothetical protein
MADVAFSDFFGLVNLMIESHAVFELDNVGDCCAGCGCRKNHYQSQFFQNTPPGQCFT